MDLGNRAGVSILLLTVLPWLLVNGSLDLKNCDLKKCRPCFTTSVTCTTTDKNEVVPQYLSKSLISLNTNFKSSDSPVVFRQSEITRYDRLQNLTISGDFSAIKRQALDILPDLTYFHVKDTLIMHLPDQLFANNQKLQWIKLIRNSFTEIPLNMFDSSTEIAVVSYTFSGQNDVLLPCFNGSMQLSIGFKRFRRLELLDLSYNTFTHPNCSIISDDFFRPVSNIFQLHIGGTNIIHTNEFSLTQLSDLRTLDISSLAPYKFCPSVVEALLFNIPRTVENLVIRNWEITSDILKTCQLTSTSLQGLMQLNNIWKLDFSFGGGIFGSKLLQTTIPKITSLTELDLTSCQLVFIERDAFSGYPQLSKLNLSGNPLGSKDLDMLSHSAPEVETLVLTDTEIRSNHVYRYQASHILCQFLNLSAIHFSSNSLSILPEFVQNRSLCNLTTYPSLTSFMADDNNIEYFVDDRNQAENICLIFPNLQTLNLSRNELHSIRGMELCTNLRNLHLQKNELFSDQGHMARILHNLVNIVSLNLGFNNLEDIDADLLIGMSYLEEVYLNDNRIRSIADGLFRNNRRLRRISLANNQIEVVGGFGDLLHLEIIDLHNNKISNLGQPLLDSVDMLQLQYFGIEHNPFDCTSCLNLYLKQWLLENIELEKSSLFFITCSYLTQSGQSVYSFIPSQWVCYNRLPLEWMLFLFLVTITIYCVLILCYKYHWYIKHIGIVWKAFKGSAEMVRNEHVCRYHAYVSFDEKSEQDSIWVFNELIPAIEGCDSSTADFSISSSDTTDQRGLHLYVEPRDAGIGGDRLAQRQKALDDSKRILIVVSNSYLKSTECLSEADLAGIQMHGTEFYQPNRILLLIREKLHEENIRPPMSSLLLGKTLTVIETMDNRKEKMWEEIRKFLSEPFYVYCEPTAVSGEASSEAINGPADCATETTPLIS